MDTHDFSQPASAEDPAGASAPTDLIDPPWGKVAVGAALLGWGLGALSLATLLRGAALAAGGVVLYRSARSAGLLTDRGLGLSLDPADDPASDGAAGLRSRAERLATAWGAPSDQLGTDTPGHPASAASQAAPASTQGSSTPDGTATGTATPGAATKTAGSSTPTGQAGRQDGPSDGGTDDRKQGLVGADVPPPIDLRGA